MIRVNLLPDKNSFTYDSLWRQCANCRVPHLILSEEGLCVYCRETREWSRRNRAFCALVHRDAPGRMA